MKKKEVVNTYFQSHANNFQRHHIITTEAAIKLEIQFSWVSSKFSPNRFYTNPQLLDRCCIYYVDIRMLLFFAVVRQARLFLTIFTFFQ